MNSLDFDYATLLAEAVVQEIWNEMGRQRITSLRELARRADMTHTSVNVRMNGDSRTGKQVTLNVRDLAALGGALGVDPAELLTRAQDALADLVIEMSKPGGDLGKQADDLAKKRAEGKKHASKQDYSSMEGDKAARDEDREKPRLD